MSEEHSKNKLFFAKKINNILLLHIYPARGFFKFLMSFKLANGFWPSVADPMKHIFFANEEFFRFFLLSLAILLPIIFLM